jgi:hypothetical protein
MEIFPLEYKKNLLGPSTQKNRTKEMSGPSQRTTLGTTPKSLIFDFDNGGILTWGSLLHDIAITFSWI